MIQAASKFQCESILTRREATRLAECLRARGSVFLRVAGIAALGMIAMASPSFAQRGGGGGAHSSGVGGGHVSGGSSGRVSGGVSHAGGSRSGSPGSSGAIASGGHLGPSESAAKSGGTGIGGAFRRLFGISHSSSKGPDVAKVGTSSAESSVVTRAAAQASLPPAFSRLRLNGSAAASLNDGAAIRLDRTAFVTARPAITALPRPIGPSPRRFDPIFFGGFAPFGFGYGFGFGSPFLGLNCFYFNCFGFNSFGYGYGPFGYGPFGYNNFGYNNFGYNNFGYNNFGYNNFGYNNFGYNNFGFDSFDPYSSSSPSHYNTNLQPAMLLYFTSGSTFEVTDYWVEGDTLHYKAENGGSGEVPVSDVDVQRTTDANGRVGFRFNLDRARKGTPLDRVEAPTNQPDEPQPQRN
jgi:hypothetical protein